MSCPSTYDNAVVLGERCSGTNFVQFMFGKSHRHWCVDVDFVKVKKKRNVHDAPFCWKHANAFQMIPAYSRFAHVQFIVLIRNPYDWVKSLFSWQHQLKYRKTIMEFITGPVIPVTLPGSSGWTQTLRNDVDPSGNYYRNPLHMRTAKYYAWLHLGRRVQCVKYIRFEYVINNPTRFADEFRIRLYPNHTRRQSPPKKVKYML